METKNSSLENNGTNNTVDKNKSDLCADGVCRPYNGDFNKISISNSSNKLNLQLDNNKL